MIWTSVYLTSSKCYVDELTESLVFCEADIPPVEKAAQQYLEACPSSQNMEPEFETGLS